MSAATRIRRLDLPPEPASVGVARRLVRDVLRDSGRTEWLDAAELAVSELVTNAVLHAHTDIVVTVETNGELRVEVADEGRGRPSPRHYGEQATTGRGMELVAAVTQQHGVTTQPSGGKVVWFVVSDSVSDGDEFDPLAAWDDDDFDVPEPSVRTRCVRLLALPSTLWLAAAEQHDALLRELALFRAARGQSNDDLAVADRARHAVRASLDDALATARAAGRVRSPLPAGHPARLAEVPPQLDLEVEVDDEMAAGFAVLQDLLDEAERLAAAEQLLAHPGLPEIVAVRDWVCEQAIAQLSGTQAAPWLGTDAERFLRRADDPRSIDWDTARVADSDRGAVAADDSNRIVAISRPLADALGWPVEDLVGRRVVAIVPPRFREAHVAGFTRHLTTGEAHAIGVDLELPVLRADATEVLCDFYIEAYRTPSGRTVYVSWVTPKA